MPSNINQLCSPSPNAHPLPELQRELAASLAPRAPLLSGSYALLSYCRQIGLDPRELVQQAGVDAELVDNPDASLSVDARLKLWQVAKAASHDEHLHLHVAERAPFGAYRIADFLCATAPSRMLALRKLVVVLAASDVPSRLRVIEGADVTSIVLEHGDAPALTQHQAEYGLAVCYLRMRLATGSDLTPLALELVGPPDSDVGEVARVFGCCTRYHCGANRLWFRHAELERVNARADHALFAILETRIAEVQAAHSSVDPLLAAVRRLVIENLEKPLPVERTARRLGMSVRVLQRRLRASGMTFTRLVEQARAQHARTLLLRRESSLSDIAGVLGFSEYSAFSRAFKRWTGDTPSDFRAGRSMRVLDSRTLMELGPSTGSPAQSATPSMSGPD